MPVECCSYPHGQWSMIALVLSIIAWVLCINTTWGCRYLKIDGYVVPPVFNPYPQSSPGRYGVGLFSYEAPDSSGSWWCYAYTENQVEYTPWLDESFKAARAMGVIADIAIGIPMLLLLAIGCVSFNLMVIKGLGCLMLLGSLAIMLTMVMFDSALAEPPFNGTFYIGPGLAIGTFLASTLTAFALFKIPEAKDPFADQPPPQAFAPGTETTTETILPDGTKKIVKTKVNPDGSQTVTETVVPADVAEEE